MDHLINILKNIYKYYLEIKNQEKKARNYSVSTYTHLGKIIKKLFSLQFLQIVAGKYIKMKRASVCEENLKTTAGSVSHWACSLMVKHFACTDEFRVRFSAGALLF